jgi:hypothetical protein
VGETPDSWRRSRRDALAERCKHVAHTAS